MKQFHEKTHFSEIQLIAKNSKNVLGSKIFQSVYRDFQLYKSKSTPSQNLSPEDTRLLSETLERSVEKVIAENGKTLNRYLSALATISSSAPFVGLLGTVIGITFSFKSISETGATSIAVVAPGISEALAATAMGIFVAIPALIAYNLFRNDIRNITIDQHVLGLTLINRFVRISRWNQ